MDNQNKIKNYANTRSHLQSPLPKTPKKNFKLDITSEYNEKNTEQLAEREKFILSPAVSPKQSPTLITKNRFIKK